MVPVLQLMRIKSTWTFWKTLKRTRNPENILISIKVLFSYIEFLSALGKREFIYFYSFLKLDPKKMISVEAEESDNENMPQISLQEMLDDFHIKEDPMDAD